MAITTSDRGVQRRSRMKSRHPIRRAGSLAVAGALAAMLAPCVHAADWHFTPNVNVSTTLTDNVRLAPRGSETSDLVTQVAPGFTAFTNTARLKANVGYSLQSTMYANSDNGSHLSNQLSANLNAVLIRDLLLFDARASVGQANISAFGPQSFSNVNATNNRTDVRTYTVSPYLVNRIGNVATTQLRYTHDAVNTGGTGFLSNSNTDRLQFDLNSGPRYLRTNWGVQAFTQQTKYSTQQNVDQSSVSINGGYLIVPTLRLTATGGYEKNNYVTDGERPNGAFYNAGFVWTPTSRTSVTANAGRRYFGTTYFLAANHRARNTVFSINYTDDITSTQQQFAQTAVSDTASQLNLLYTPQIPDPVARQRFVNALMLQFNLPSGLVTGVNTFTNRYFEQKSLQGSVAVSGAHSTVIGTLFDTRRLPLSAPSAQLAAIGFDDSSKQVGGSASWNLKLSPRTSALLTGNVSRSTSLTTSRVDDYKVVRVGLNTAFQQRLTGGLEFRHSTQKSDFIGGDIRENALTASVLMQF